MLLDAILVLFIWFVVYVVFGLAFWIYRKQRGDTE